MRTLKDILRPLIHALALLTAVWVITIISITSCTYVIRRPEASAPELAPILETKIFVQIDERPGFEYTAFDVPEPGETIFRVVNGAKVGATLSEASKAQNAKRSCRRQGKDIKIVRTPSEAREVDGFIASGRKASCFSG